MCVQKNGSLGVRGLGFFNIALTGKWVWRSFNDKKSLWAKGILSLDGDIALREDDIISFSRESIWSSW